MIKMDMVMILVMMTMTMMIIVMGEVVNVICWIIHDESKQKLSCSVDKKSE